MPPEVLPATRTRDEPAQDLTIHPGLTAVMCTAVTIAHLSAIQSPLDQLNLEHHFRKNRRNDTKIMLI